MKLTESRRWGWLLALLLGCLPQTAAAQEMSDAARTQYNAAIALQNRGEYEMAADEWTKFLTEFKTEPRCDFAQYQLGCCQLQSNKLDQAEQSFQAVIKNFPKSEQVESATLNLGVTQYRKGQGGKAEMFDAAMATFDLMAKTWPQGKYAAEAVFWRGECAYAKGNKKEAAQYYAQFVEKYPNDKLQVAALYALGVAQQELDDQAAAGKTFDAFLAKFPQNPLAAEVELRRGDSFFAAGQLEEAVKRFAQAAARQGFAKADLAKYRQATALERLNKLPEAAVIYGEVAATPKSEFAAAAAVAQGKCLYQSGKLADAQKLLAGSAAAGGDVAAEAAHWLARMLLKDGKPGEALATVEKILPNSAQSPLATQLLMDQADALFDMQDRRKEAAPLYAAIAVKYPKDALAAQGLYLAAYASLHVGDNNQALKYAQEFLAAYADNDLAVDVRYIAAEATLQNKQYAEAEKLFAELTAKYPAHADAEAWKVRRGVALALQGKHAEAIASIEAVLKELKTPTVVGEALFVIGSSQAELKQFDAAAKSLEASLAAAPKGPKTAESLALLGQVYLQTKNDAKAKAALARLAAEFPESALLDQAHYRLGEGAFAAGDWKGAAAEYQTVLDKWPQSALVPYAWFGLGWSRLNAKEFEAAEKAFDALLEKKPEEKLALRTRCARGSVRQQLGKFAPAIEDLQAFLASNPPAAEKSEARYVLGLCYYGLKQFGEASKVLQEIIKDDPQTTIADKVYYDLAWSLKEQKLEKEAADDFAACAAARADGPLAPESLHHVGEFAYANNDFAKAALNYYAAMQKAGKTVLGEKAAHKLAWSYFRQDKLTDAQKTFAYQRATWPQGPLSSDAAFMEGECFFKQKQYDDAIKAYDQVKNPTEATIGIAARLHKAVSLGKSNKWEQSVKLLAEVAKDGAETPYALEAIYEQGFALKNLNKPGEAQAMFEKVIAQSKTDNEIAAKAQFMIGEVEFDQKKFTEAVKSFFKVAYGYGYPKWQAVAMYEAARAFEALGKKDQAVKQYRELVEKFPGAAESPLAADRLKVLDK